MQHRAAVFCALAFTVSAYADAQQPRSPLLDSFEQARKLRSETPVGLRWVPLGPTLNSARVEAVQCHPSNPGMMLVAFGSGNLWRTINHGLTWEPLFEDQSALGIGDIAIAPSDPNVIWLGSGESLKKARNFTMPGTGVFRSEDAGATWSNVGLHDSWHIGEVAVHPTDPDTVLVAVQGHFWSSNPHRGIYRTTDAGQTWEHALAVSERVGANDVVIAPSDPNIAYASTWENYPDIAGPESGVYRSTDGGATWTRLRGGLPLGERTGRIGLAVSWSNPNKVYALIDNLNRERHPAELYGSTDGGETWARTHQDDLQIFSRIGWYFTDCYVNPQDDEEVYCLGVRIARSRNGGQDFELIGGDVFHFVPNPAESLHLDHCEMYIDPENADHLVLGNDGGLFVSYDRGATWMHYNNIPTGEFYDIAVDEATPYRIYGGTQDDSSVAGPAREWRPELADGWEYVWLDPWSGGDGCYTVPDPNDPDTVYFSSQHGGIKRQNRETMRSKGIRPRLPRNHSGSPLRYNFIAPYILSPHDSRTIYHAGNYIFKSVNRGDDWERISPDLAVSADSERKSEAAGAIAESRLKRGLIYVGTDRGAFWVTEDDGETWTEYSEGLSKHYIRSIFPSRFEEGRVYLAASGINYDDLSASLFVSEDHGATWRSIVSNLPDEVAYAIVEDPTHPDLLYAAMYRGVYVSLDRGEHWSHLGYDLPAVAVADLVIQEPTMDLIAGTHGRGMYRTNLRPLQRLAADGLPTAPVFFDIPMATLPLVNDIHPDGWMLSRERIPISFYLPTAGSVELRVTHPQGQGQWLHRMEAGPGLHQVRWDLVTDRRESPEAYFFRHLRLLPAGDYQVELTVGDQTIYQPFTVRRR